MRPYVEIDRWPLVVIRWPASISEAEVDEFAGLVTSWLERREHVAHVLDLRNATASSVGPTIRSRGLARLVEMRAIAEAHLAAEAIVATTAFARHAVTAFSWLAPPTWPRRVFDGQVEAEKWARAELATCARPSGYIRTSGRSSPSARTR